MNIKNKKKLILNNIYDIVQKFNATAIIILGKNNLKIKKIKNIPIIYTNSNINSILEKVSSISSSYSFNKKSLFHSIIPIEYGLENIREGTIIGIINLKYSFSITIYDLFKDPIFIAFKKIKKRISSHVFSSILKLALDIAIFGREGKKIGTAFIIGDTKNVLIHSHQMIINPYRFQNKRDKEIFRKENWESIKNFAQLDGVFIVSKDGEIICAGRYLDVDKKKLKVEKGLGSRHISAASITMDTNAIAIIISESGGTIRIYMDGKEIFFIDPYIISLIINKKIY